MSPSIWQLFIVLAVILIVFLIFGSKNIRNLGSDLGGFIKGFRNAVKDDTKEAQEETEPANDQKETDSKP
ncbi:MAG: Sec-independent protein translocase subunit TatA [Gammaproteobacteria bacterium]|nr:Sec-independent protein translocase subunit TatA [Gammaproteobacteria bacterium]MYF03077.1 Sec-independent protein translocase subunit TatA [Gammaproteobacteria bacterium]